MSNGGGNSGGDADGPGIVTLSVWAAAAITVLAVVLGPQVRVSRQCLSRVFFAVAFNIYCFILYTREEKPISNESRIMLGLSYHIR